MCKAQIQHKNKHMTCKFFVLSGHGSALLTLPDIKLLDILRIECSTINVMYGSAVCEFILRLSRGKVSHIYVHLCM